jgi:hypothetical protein
LPPAPTAATNAAAPDAAAFVVIAEAESGSLADTVARAGLIDALRTLPAGIPDIVVLVDMAGFDAANPGIEAARVEALIDVLCAERPACIQVAASADSSVGWAGNRDVYARAELAGYRYTTDAGHDYDIIDLGDDVRDDAFPAASALAGTPAAAAWADADLRIVCAGLHTDAADGYAGALATLLGALPLADSDLHYRQRRDVGEVAVALLQAMPPHFALIDAQATTGAWIASRNILLADYAAALRFGVDPSASPLFAAVAAALPLPAAHVFDGEIAPLSAAARPTPMATKLARARAANADVATLTAPWLQALDTAQFPPLHPIDARFNSLVAGLEGGTLRHGLDLLVALAADAVTGWQTLFDKDALLRRDVALGIEPGDVPTAAFDAMVASLDSLAPVARSAPERGPALRWRKIGGAVVFAYACELAIPFDAFTAKVDVAHAISYMNDYLGGVVLPLDSGRQLERNLYLPQPNYLVLFGGKPIDVTKIEVVRRGADAHELYWQTLFSSNDTARADDGIVTFTRTAQGTAVEIVGQQDFTLPPFWQLFDVGLIPALETALVTHAYQTFFHRTRANFEALAEGRSIAIGRDGGPATAQTLETLVTRVTEAAEPWLARLRPAAQTTALADADGYVHGGGA